jgi:4-hydroxy-tetrahydrodipicolinate synthase
MMFTGSIPALITPFFQGEIDTKSLADFIEWQIQNGSHGVVSCGTTGESPTLNDVEYKTIFDVTTSVVKGRIPFIAGTGSNSTRKTIELTNMAREARADAALVVVPYYNRPTKEGLYAHYKAIHDSTDIPLIIYNVPGRTGCEIAVDTILRLAELPRIKGLKDATSDISRTSQIKSALGRDFYILSGEDALAGGFLAQGADGCISVTANIAPRQCADFQEAWHRQDLSSFVSLQNQLMPLHKALFVETSPAPVKYAASVLGLCHNELRLPMLPASQTARLVVDKALQESGLMSGSEPATLRRHGTR